MSSFTNVVHCLDKDFVLSIAISAEQIEAASEGGEGEERARGLEAVNLGLARAFPVPRSDLELARHVNEFLAERPAL